MQEHITRNRGAFLFFVLSGFFVANALIAEFIGVKIFSLEDSLGLQAWNFNLFGQAGSLKFSAGVLLWPIVFIMTDLINEYYGFRAVKYLSWLTAALILYGFLMIYVAIALVPADWWIVVNQGQGVPDMQAAFAQIYGQSNWIIVGSMVAFLVGQLLDATVFLWIRKALGEKLIWVRATASTAISQLVDTFLVAYIAFVLGPQQWPMSLLFAVSIPSYAYKLLMAFALIPMLYGVRYAIEKYLGAANSRRLRETAVE